MSRLWSLIFLSTKSTLQRWRHDLAKELVVLVCSLVLGSLFYYIFNDFINHQVAEISLNMMIFFAKVLLWFCGCSAGAWTGKVIVEEFLEDRSIFQFIRSESESSVVTWIFGMFRVVFLLFTIYGFFLILAKNLFPAVFLTIYTHVLSGMVVMTLVVGLFLARKKQNPDNHFGYKKISWPYTKYPVWNMFFWRVRQLLWVQRLPKLCFLVAMFFIFVSVLFTHQGAPLVASVTLSFTGGIFAAAGMCFAIAEDIRYAWMEKSVGIDHDTYMGALGYLGSFLALVLITIYLFLLLNHWQ